MCCSCIVLHNLYTMSADTLKTKTASSPWLNQDRWFLLSTRVYDHKYMQKLYLTQKVRICSHIVLSCEGSIRVARCQMFNRTVRYFGSLSVILIVIPDNTCVHSSIVCAKDTGTASVRNFGESHLETLFDMDVLLNKHINHSSISWTVGMGKLLIFWLLRE